MLVNTCGSAVFGIDAIPISVEVSVSAGKDYSIVGLPDAAVKESLSRIETAIKCIGLMMPRTKILVNLAPADIKKTGAAFDLPIALAILAASGQIPNPEILSRLMIMGELSLDGEIRPIKGILPMAILAKNQQLSGFICPIDNANEASIIQELAVYGVKNLGEAVQLLRTSERRACEPVNLADLVNRDNSEYADFKDVKGQEHIKKGMEIAAAGRHNMLMIGPPGAGKTMLAKCFPSILPELSLEEMLEITKIYSVTGLLRHGQTLIAKRPFRAPHHTTSDIALVGGGSYPQPGEISLAHNGVLFLDELPEFKRSVLEVLRQPLEDGLVHISRARSSVCFPAKFLLLAAMNPCPCGYYNHPTRACTCSELAIKRYTEKISGPLLDRIDIHSQAVPLDFASLSNKVESENSASIRARVDKARQRQQARFQNNYTFNANMSAKEVEIFCEVDEVGRKLLQRTMEKFALSARSYHRLLKVARTVADLADSDKIESEHIAVAIHCRSLDRGDWGNSG